MYFTRSKPHERFVEEKRSEERLSFRSPDEFVVEFKSKKSDRYRLGFGRDISSVGIRFASPVPLKPKEKLELTIHFTDKFPGTKTLQVKAEVVRGYRLRGTPYVRVGCRLIHPEEKTKKAILQFLDWVKSTMDFAFLEDAEED